ncbi:hypothetical protein A1F97_08506 [Pyrenophora tritici-repentis]|nr:hypothetical protein PtrSN001C_010453 [Pyrenophora tritici-repentis]KAI1580520.1 hypothetical protein PtrEW13061_009972 [Pyrenophora tritici-repentis]KAI1595177.1 hypothetical protein PtrCC142_010498 [Pyrenophora tritici-repentis]PWO21101.1 pre splicing factor ini1 [Pyrenophora tritici-repentis]PZC89817.1 hypothetical protein A1F95_10013 [Pyrenophora tritici-repentis]
MLRSLEQVWTSHEHDFRLIMEQRFNDHQRALHIWIGQRRKTSQLQMMIDRQPSAQTLEMVDRVLVMNDLRILQLKWKALRVHVHSQDSTPGDLLCSTFAIMTRTQGTEALFKEGLERLKETSPELASPIRVPRAARNRIPPITIPDVRSTSLPSKRSSRRSHGAIGREACCVATVSLLIPPRPPSLSSHPAHMDAATRKLHDKASVQTYSTSPPLSTMPNMHQSAAPAAHTVKNSAKVLIA